MAAQILSGARVLTGDDLQARARRAASGFQSLGIKEGDAVATFLRNDFPFFEAAFGADLIGAYNVPINWHFKGAETAHILKDSGAKALVVHEDLLGAVADSIPAGVAVFTVPTPAEIAEVYSPTQTTDGLPGLSGTRDWSACLAGQTPFADTPRSSRNAVIYTSGTTGAPKGVRRAPADQAMAARMADIIRRTLGISLDKPVRTVITGPIYHAAPNLYSLWAVRSGGLTILQPRFNAVELLALIERHRITHLHMVPTMFVRLLQLPEETRRRFDLSSLEFVAHAAAPCPPDIKQRMIEWWGPVINEYYGGTETGGVVFCSSEEALRKPGTVGRALQGCSVRVLDSEGRILGANEIGEIYLRNTYFPDFTYNNRDDLRAEIERDGHITIGDIGYLDKEGYLFLCDRARDMIISGGVNIYPAEVEAELISMPGVADCAVFGIPDPEYGESVCACIEPQSGVTLTSDEVRAFLRARLAEYKVPRRVEFRHDLPREDSGKIFKRKLRDSFWEAAGRRI